MHKDYDCILAGILWNGKLSFHRSWWFLHILHAHASEDEKILTYDTFNIFLGLDFFSSFFLFFKLGPTFQVGPSLKNN